MFAPFEEESARNVCLQMISELEEKKSLGGNTSFYNFVGMFGALVCLDRSGNQVVLKAFSGACGGKWNIEGFAPPLFDEEKYIQAVQINDRKIHELSEAPADESPVQKAARKAERLKLCNETLERLYSLYRFTCFDGVERNFCDIADSLEYAAFKNSASSDYKRTFVIPTGTGDCCAPKLLGEAFSKKLRPVSLAEFFWNPEQNHTNTCASGKTAAVRAAPGLVHKKFYPPCDEKCSLILPVILGLKIIYRDKNIIVIDKPGGLLSVPGRGPEKQDCAVRRLQALFPETMEQPSVHRLDMDTSGLMVLAFDKESQRNLSLQFQTGGVHKKYIAVLDGIPHNEALGITHATQGGRIELRHRVDIENRPVQIYDEVYGKLAVTDWKRERIWNMDGKTVTTVKFEPQTGRTHQLRFASAGPYGLDAPIVGDDLYGKEKACIKKRLLLHACFLSFIHPATGERMEFSSEPAFRY